jgi:hypothetical protein
MKFPKLDARFLVVAFALLFPFLHGNYIHAQDISPESINQISGVEDGRSLTLAVDDSENLYTKGALREIVDLDPETNKFELNRIGIQDVAPTQEAPGVRKSNILLEAAILNSFSASYERHIFTSKGGKSHFYGKVGLARLYFAEFLSRSNFNQTGAILAGTYLTGMRNGHLEINAGLFAGPVTRTDYNDCGFFSSSSCMPSITTEETFEARPYLELGYRYQKPEGGFIYRVKLGTLGLGIGLGAAF